MAEDVTADIRRAAQQELRLAREAISVGQEPHPIREGELLWFVTDLATGRRWRVVDGQEWPADHGYWFEEVFPAGPEVC